MSEITKIRKNLHQNPELSGKEFKTAKTIAAFLKNHNPDDLLENLGSGTGIIAVYHPELEIKKTVMFRSELDALPIQEINDFEHRSAVDGISHKCGHDGHMSILCDFAKKLSLQKMKHTKILLLFQPSEENGEGALSIFNDARFKTFNLDLVFALHNLPGFPHHEIVVKNNTFSCAVHSIIIKLFGRTAHAGEPHNGENPALAISEIITAFNKKSQPDHQKRQFHHSNANLYQHGNRRLWNLCRLWRSSLYHSAGCKFRNARIRKGIRRSGKNHSTSIQFNGRNFLDSKIQRK